MNSTQLQDKFIILQKTPTEIVMGYFLLKREKNVLKITKKLKAYKNQIKSLKKPCKFLI